MATYAAAVSLLKTVSQLQDTPNCPSKHITLVGKFVGHLTHFLGENREVKEEFESQIRDAIYEAQDIIDSRMLSTPSEAQISNQSFLRDLLRVTKILCSLVKTAKEKFDYKTLDRKISNSVWKKSEEIDCTDKYPIVGRDEDLNQLKDRLMSGSKGLEVIPIVGIAGMGKTTLAQEVYNDPLIRKYFEASGWVKVSVNYNKHDKLLDLLQSTKRHGDGVRQDTEHQFFKQIYNWSDEILQKTDEQLMKILYKSLKYKRYLIILDDIRDIAAWKELKQLFPDFKCGSRILLTTRNVDLASVVGTPHLLDRVKDEDSVALLRAIVFREEPCPPELVDIATDIAESCIGLPHAVVIVGRLLLCANFTTEYWKIVLSSINTCENSADLIKALVSLTYKHLPQKLKVCLLYMAIFPYNEAIPLMKFVTLWMVERFLLYVVDFEDMEIAINYGQELSLRGLLVMWTNTRDTSSVCGGIAEEVFHDFLVRKAEEEKFFLVINKHTSLQDDTTYNQHRRLCIQQNIHRRIKDLSDCNTNSNARSILYFGPEHQHPLRSWSDGFKRLEVLDALKIGFYTFPPEILKLVVLRYLALSYNRQLPATLCNLRNLQVLIVSHYLNWKCSGVPSHLPPEIWNLKDLMHLQVMGSDLPEPPQGTGLLLEKLFLLLDVSTHSCTRNTFERITNLRTLEVRIESLPEDESLSFLSYLNILNKLRHFKCVVMYPDIETHVISSSIPAFPSTLTLLTLSGSGFPWEYMRVIAALPDLQLLKLQNYAFHGPEWKVKGDEFQMLDFLLLEDIDFENWTFDSSTGSIFWKLECLTIRHCYRLRDIPSIFADSSALKMLEVVDCSTSAMNSALEIKEKLASRNDSFRFDIYSSLDD